MPVDWDVFGRQFDSATPALLGELLRAVPAVPPAAGSAALLRRLGRGPGWRPADAPAGARGPRVQQVLQLAAHFSRHGLRRVGHGLADGGRAT